LTAEAVEVIKRHAKLGQQRPLFLYFALTAPHTPWLPTREFLGKGAAGMYGEFVAQVDDTLGQLLAALDQTGMARNALVFFTSDNGPVWYDKDVQRLGHDSAGPLRGMKGDSWEAGHRVPFMARWPGQIGPGGVSSRLICFTDFLATLADIVGLELSSDSGHDSFSFLPELLGQKRAQAGREALVLKGNASVFRQGHWKLITHLGSGGFSEPREAAAENGGPLGQLYNLADDLGETQNLWSAHPEIVQRMQTRLQEIRRGKPSR
jgi:arylsulfatase A-like enzyme